jgi:hypothetical protein
LRPFSQNWGLKQHIKKNHKQFEPLQCEI